MELIQHDSTRAMATFAQLSLEPGEYNVNLVTRDGREHAAPKLLFRVTKAPPKLTGPTNTDVSRNSNGQNEFTGPASDLAEIAKIQAFQNDKLDEAVNLTPGEIKGDKLVASYEIGKDAKLGAHILELTTKGGQTSPTELILTVTEAAPQPRPDGPEETKVKAESGEFTVGFTGANLDQVQKIEAVQNGVVDEAVKFISAEPSEGKLVAKFQAGKADPGKHLWKVIPKKGERILTKLLLIITE